MSEKLKVNDEVIHDKTSRRGVVLEVDWHGKAGSTRVQFKDRQTILSEKALRRVADMSDADEEVERQRAAVRKKSQIPYDTMDNAVRAAREMFPAAEELKPLWYMGNVLVEVWEKGKAKVIPYQGE